MAPPNQLRNNEEQHVRCLKQDVIALIGAIVIFNTIVILALAATLSAFKAPEVPSFDNPIKGFEPRGTDLSNRINTAARLRDPNNKQLRADTATANQTTPPETGHNWSLKDNKSCPIYYTVRLVFESKSSGNLLTANKLKSMCYLEEKIMKSSPSSYNSYYYGGCPDCCTSISLGSIIAQFVNKTCEKLDDKDVKRAVDVLQNCSVYITKGELNESCSCSSLTNNCTTVPCICNGWKSGVYIILNHLTDSEFLKTPNQTIVKYSAILSSIQRNSYDLYKYIYETHLQDSFPEYNGVKVVGFEFDNFRFDLFNIVFVENAKYPAIAMVLVLIIMCFFLKSFILAFAAILTIIFALVLSYFLYMVAFGIKFFPFLNVVTLVFIVGIGADDAFVYYDIFRKTKSANPNASVVTLTLKTLRYAAISMFVTSFTTSAAFFANLTSDITSIKLFGIYAGLSILTNYVLMITWFPVVVMMHERWVRKRTVDQTLQADNVDSRQGDTEGSAPLYDEIDNRDGSSPVRDGNPRSSLACQICWVIDFPCYFITRGTKFISSISTKLFDKWLLNAILHKKLYFLWIFLFIGFTIGFTYISFVSPGLRLPTSKDFQLFSWSSTIEQYNLHIKDKFRYASENRGGLMVEFVWGVKAQDNGNYLDPDNKGSFVYDSSFNSELATESQKWLSSTCKSLIGQSFYSDIDEFNAGSICGIERLRKNCLETNDTCCKNVTSIPFPMDVLAGCPFWRMPTTYYDKQTGDIKAMSMYFYSNVLWTAEYESMDKFWNQIITWADKQLLSAPASLKNGWVVCRYLDQMYSLQYSLQKGTVSSMGVSLGIAFGVMLLTTLNIFISVYAIVTIIGILAMTVGCLVLVGWQLSVLESFVFSVSVGLSIDFTMHYGVAYRLSPNKDNRKDRIHYSFVHIGSAVLMAAVTTFITGLLMMPAKALAYIQLGQFLMLVMVFSWLFATFAFFSLSAFIGPVGNFGQLNITSICRMIGLSKVTPNDDTIELSNINPEPVKANKRAKLATGPYYEVERIISKRNRNGNTEYLLQWKGYSKFYCSWEDEGNLTRDLIRSYDKPEILKSRLQANADILLHNIITKLKSTSNAPLSFAFDHDCFRFLFGGKGYKPRDGKALMLEKEDFLCCNFFNDWDQCFDKNGNGVIIQFPMRVGLDLSYSPSINVFQGGKVVKQPRMPVEKLKIDFVRKPSHVFEFACFLQSRQKQLRN